MIMAKNDGLGRAWKYLCDETQDHHRMCIAVAEECGNDQHSTRTKQASFQHYGYSTIRILTDRPALANDFTARLLDALNALQDIASSQ